MTKEEYELALTEQVGSYIYDPLGFAHFAFPWGEDGPLKDYSGPREWQARIMNVIGEHLRNPETRYDPLQIAVASGHGIGKSAEMGMISNWAMSCFVDARIVITANTEKQMLTKTSPEVRKWHKYSLTSDWFTRSSTKIASNDPDHKDWRMDFVSWSKDNTESFAGLHNKDNIILILFDEASAIDDKVWEVTEGALTDENTVIIWIAFGNPTRNTGHFRECFRKYSKQWYTEHIDSRDVEGTNTKKLQAIIDKYGEDSDQARYRVKGQFPRASANQFFSQEILDEARGKHLRGEQYEFAGKVITVDPAWTGDDDLVIALRQGLYFKILKTIAKNDNDFNIAAQVAAYQDQYEADQVFIDQGYGTGIYSAGKNMGRHWQLVAFGEKAIREDCFNKRAEMYVNIKDWLLSGGALPDDDELYEEMIAVEVGLDDKGRFKMPPKKDFKDIIGRSPNKLDALALSFAFPVQPKHNPMYKPRQLKRKAYDPMDQI